MSRKMIIGFCAVILVITLTNLFSGYINVFYWGLYHEFKFETTNKEFHATYHFGQGSQMKNIQDRYEKFKKNHPEIDDITLYRTFKINPLEFWNWYQFISHPMYRYPYKQPAEVIKKNNQ